MLRRLPLRRASARAVRALLTLGVVFVAGFALLHLRPGDPAERLDDPAIPAAQAERTRQALGLDRPLPLQFATTVGSYLRGELGVSVAHHRPVRDVLVEALPATALLGFAGLLVSYFGGLVLALVILRLPPRTRARAEEAVLVAATVPRFWLGVVLLMVFHDWIGWLPASHAAPPGGGSLLERLRHLVLPVATLALPMAAVVARYLLAEMEERLRGPGLRTARAAGLSGLRLNWRELLLPSLGPAIALFGTDLPVIASGAVVVETVFAWPGLGRIAAGALLGADYPLALACLLLSSLVVVAGGALADLLAGLVDPRLASGPGAGR